MVIEEKSSLFESAFAIGGVLVAIILTFSSPKLESALSRQELADDRDQKVQEIASLEASLAAAQNDNEALRAQLVEVGSVLQQAQTHIQARQTEINDLEVDISALKVQRDGLTAQLQDKDRQLEDLRSQIAEFQEFLSVQQAAGERDEALERAQKAEERIRQLTLQLHNAGVYP